MQRRKFNEDMEALRKEADDIRAQKDKAADQLQQCVNGQAELVTAQGGARPVETRFSAQDQQQWDRLMSAGVDESRDDSTQWLQRSLHAAMIGGPQALSQQERARLQGWLEQHTSRATASDPLGAEVVSDAMLQQKLSLTLAQLSTAAPSHTPGRPLACPPGPSGPPVVGPSMPRLPGARLRPFPPPHQPANYSGADDQRAPPPCVSDPYGASNAPNAEVPHGPDTGHPAAMSPSGGPPKTPRPRQQSHPYAKPSAEGYAAKKAALSEAPQGPVQSFILHDDDLDEPDTGQPALRAGREGDVMD